MKKTAVVFLGTGISDEDVSYDLSSLSSLLVISPPDFPGSPMICSVSDEEYHFLERYVAKETRYIRGMVLAGCPRLAVGKIIELILRWIALDEECSSVAVGVLSEREYYNLFSLSRAYPNGHLDRIVVVTSPDGTVIGATPTTYVPDIDKLWPIMDEVK